MSYGWYFYITWLPTYIQEARGQTMERSAFLAGMPLFFGGIGSLVCGYLLTWLDRKMGGSRRSRRFMGVLGCAGAGALLIVSVYLSEPVWAMVAMGLASFSNDLAMPPSWSACMDVGGKYAGSLSGSMNMAGNMAGFVSPAMVPYILRWTGRQLAHYVLCLGGDLLCWRRVLVVYRPGDTAGPGRCERDAVAGFPAAGCGIVAPTVRG